MNKTIEEIKQLPLVEILNEDCKLPVPVMYYYQDGNTIYILADNETLEESYELA